eukprot:TRINITY_DN3012_c0_g1_i3.p1 TRINITY_DN3012_c0_g1~~TRINITY_DN3012_c0_g1_i3.p1  ORF type:complete len:420 (+),score=152.09 TRINITY_DN3012_c0_g1_i3:88-1260(+)
MAAAGDAKRQRTRSPTRKLLRKDGMEYRPLGSSGMEVSSVGLGCFSFGGDRKTGGHLGSGMAKLHEGVWGDQDEADSAAAVKAALDCGINFFDNAEMYGDGYAEEVLGRSLKASGYERYQYAVATKVCESYLEPALLRERLDGSLGRMGMDYVDLYQVHWHSRAAVGSERYPERPLKREVPLEQTLKALDDLRSAGKIRHIGVCNFGPKDLTAALKTGVPVVSNQVCYNLLWRGIEKELLPLCRENGVGVLPWSPLAQGILAGKFKSADEVPAGRARTRLFSSKRPQQRHGEAGHETAMFEAVAGVRRAAAALDVPMARLSLAWAMSRDGVSSCLMGARDAKQVRENLECMRLRLPEQTVRELDAATIPLRDALGSNLDPYETAAHSRIQ